MHPGSPFARGAAKPTPRVHAGSRHGDTFVVTLLELLVEVGSPGAVSETVAVSVKLPFCVGLTTRVTVTVAPFPIVPMVQTTVCCFGFGVHVPCVELTVPNPAFLGRVSVTVTPWAASGPLLCTVIVYVMACPTWPVDGPDLVTERSAMHVWAT